MDIIEARYVSNYTIWLRFEDGSEGEVDVSSELYGPVFEPLKDPAYFSRFRVNPRQRHDRMAESRRFRAGVPLRESSRRRVAAALGRAEEIHDCRREVRAPGAHVEYER